MSIIDFEIEEIRKLCENVIPNAKIIACVTSPDPLVRVDIRENEIRRQITVCLRFPPPEDYPKEQNILIELKSRFLSQKFLEFLTSLAEKHAREHHKGKPQGLAVLRFIQEYLRDNPLCVCVDEIQQLRRDLQSAGEASVEASRAATDQLKLKQRSSTVHLTAKGGLYYYRVRAVVPEDYPQSCVKLEEPETNLPAVLLRYLNGQSREIARQCVEAPLRLAEKNKAAFEPSPSLYLSLKFCLEATRDFYREECPICQQRVLPENPNDLISDDGNDQFVERVYCGHLFHQGCLKKYLQEPPFPRGGKLCPAKRRHARSDSTNYMRGGKLKIQTPQVGGTAENEECKCGQRLAHDRWVVNIKLAESRWAQKQARERELEEVMDFLQ